MYGMKLQESKAVIDITTCQSYQTDAARTFLLGRSGGEFNSDTIWQGTEAYPEMGLSSDTTVFAQVFYEDGSVKDRAEFWGVVKGKTYTADPDDAQKKSVDILITSRVGEIAG
jgi:hypothetical protein